MEQPPEPAETSAAAPALKPPYRYFAQLDGWLSLAESETKGRYLVARRPIPSGQHLLYAEPYGLGVHESHRKRFCQGCFRFTHLRESAVEQQEQHQSSADPEEQTTQSQTVGEANTTSQASQSQEEVTSTIADREEASEEKGTETDEKVKKKVSRKCTAQIWCEGCRQCWYCSIECKEQDDKTIVRVLLHVLARREMEAEEEPPVGKPRFEDFLCLVANTPSVSTTPERYKVDMEVVRQVERMVAGCPLKFKYSSQELLEFISKIESNTFGMWSDKLVSMGMVLYAEGSYFNHSCAPNCGTRTGEGQAVQFITTHDVAEGEEVCIRYIDVEKPTSARRSELLSHYHFTCMCPLCTAADSLSSNAPRTKYSHHPTRPGKIGKKGRKEKDNTNNKKKKKK